MCPFFWALVINVGSFSSASNITYPEDQIKDLVEKLIIFGGMNRYDGELKNPQQPLPLLTICQRASTPEFSDDSSKWLCIVR
jgi:hypothetical protein